MFKTTTEWNCYTNCQKRIKKVFKDINLVIPLHSPRATCSRRQAGIPSGAVRAFIVALHNDYRMRVRGGKEIVQSVTDDFHYPSSINY